MLTSTSYHQANVYQRQQICNGCGTHGLIGKLVPDIILGRCISEACNIHDWMYSDGDIKLIADLYFLINLILFEFNDFQFLSIFRIPIYILYYLGVSIFGLYFYLRASDFKLFKSIKRTFLTWN